MLFCCLLWALPTFMEPSELPEPACAWLSVLWVTSL